MSATTYEAIDGVHRITIAKEKGYPKTLDCIVYSIDKNGRVQTDAKTLPVSALTINRTINPRELVTKILKLLRQHWDPAALGVIHVRQNADTLPDRVAAGLFDSLNDHAAVTFFDKFQSKITQRDPSALAIVDILSKYDLELNKAGGDGRVRSANTLWGIYGGDRVEKQPELLSSTLATAIHAWGRVEDAMDHQVLRGISLVLKRHGDLVDRETLSRKLAKSTSPGALLGNARSLQDIIGGSAANCVAEVIIETYNKGLRTNKLPGWRT